MKTQKFNSRALSLAVASILALSIGAFSGGSYAATATANLNVSATVTETCTISTTALAFGEYVTGSGNVQKDGTGVVSTVCTIGTDSGIITLSQGANPAGGSSTDVPLRQMISGSDLLGYFLYSESTRTTVWGDTPATGLATATGTGAETSLTVYGRIPAGQNKPAGNYTDTVVATVTW